MSDLVRFGVAMERALLDAFDDRIARGGWANRSEALRDLVRADLARDAWEHEGDVVATISIVYDHTRHDLGERLTEIQHGALGTIVSSMHVHLDRDHCLEVVVARGPSRAVRALGDRLVSAKGVLGGDVSATSLVARAR